MMFWVVTMVFARCYSPSHNGPAQTAAECGGLSYNCIHTLAAVVDWQQWPEELLTGIAKERKNH